MPLSPTMAQSAASRRNGALSAGPVTPEGRAASARNAVARHGLRGAAFRLFPHKDEAAFQALHADLRARHRPCGPAEEHCVEQLAFALWRQRRLCALEAAALDTPEPDADPPPSLDTLARYRARIERDCRGALAELERLRPLRPRPRAELAGAGAAEPAPCSGTDEPETEAAAPAAGTPEPEPPLSPALNRAARRRLAAVQRLAQRRTA